MNFVSGFLSRRFGPTPVPASPQYEKQCGAKEYGSHREWAGRQSIGLGMQCIMLATMQPVTHHCRIGKVREK